MNWDGGGGGIGSTCVCQGEYCTIAGFPLSPFCVFSKIQEPLVSYATLEVCVFGNHCLLCDVLFGSGSF